MTPFLSGDLFFVSPPRRYHRSASRWIPRPDGAHDRTDDRTLADQRYDAFIARIDKNQAIADQRHTQIMAQFEKLLAKPSEN
jgi:hypothetical protein